MSDPTAAAANPAGKTTDSSKGWKALPTDRVGFEKQLAILQAYGAVAAEEGKTASAIAEVVGIHASSVSVCNAFFTESAFIERAGVGNKATPDVVAYQRAIEWDATTAGEKLAPTLRQTWFWKVLAPRLSFRPVEEGEAIRILADECGAGKTYRPQIKALVDYLEVGKLVVREGTLIKRGPLGGDSGSPKPDADPGRGMEERTPKQQAEKGNANLAAGIAFDASIRVGMDELVRMTPEQIKEFFAGLAVVIAAKNRAGQTTD